MNIAIIPNAITIFRFSIIPVVCILMLIDSSQSVKFTLAALLCFILACISDFLDGYLARKLNAESEFGKCFDNIADKLLNVSVICVLVFKHIVWILPAILVITREILVSSFREYGALRGVRISVDMFGKVKTTAQFAGIILLIASCMEHNFSKLKELGNIIFALSATLSVASAAMYIKKYFSYNYAR